MIGMAKTFLATLAAAVALTSALGAQAPVALGAQAPAVTLKVGDQAPDFTLQASDGKTYSLADYRGKKAVVVAWFPKAFTAGCTLECKSLASIGDRLRMCDVVYIMVSVHPLIEHTVFTHSD